MSQFSEDGNLFLGYYKLPIIHIRLIIGILSKGISNTKTP